MSSSRRRRLPSIRTSSTSFCGVAGSCACALVEGGARSKSVAQPTRAATTRKSQVARVRITVALCLKKIAAGKGRLYENFRASVGPESETARRPCGAIFGEGAHSAVSLLDSPRHARGCPDTCPSKVAHYTRHGGERAKGERGKSRRAKRLRGEKAKRKPPNLPFRLIPS